MPQKIAILCPLCQSADYTVTYRPSSTIDDPALLYGAASGVRGTQQLVTCRGCGMLYENPRYPEADIIAGYAASQESGHDSQFDLRVGSFLEALTRLAADLPRRGAKVLDIGSAGGAFLSAAQQFGYEAYGLEPSHDLVQQATRRGLNVRQGTLDRHDFAPTSFDLVCFWDVLEHVVDPIKTLRQARALLKPDGVLLVNYPDIGTWAARLMGRRFWWILSSHVVHFSPQTMRLACAKAGFQATKFAPYWQALELGYLFSVAGHLGVPFARQVGQWLPKSVARLRIRYWASQTTALARMDGGAKGTAA